MPSRPSSLYDISEKIGARQVVTVESCTGGLLAAALTELPGTSAHYHHGYVTYSNDAKIALGVNSETIKAFGAVSKETALEMAKAGRTTLPDAGFCIAVTGIAGPGTSEHKPVGLVYIAINDEVREFRFSGERSAIRNQSVEAALDWLASLL